MKYHLITGTHSTRNAIAIAAAIISVLLLCALLLLQRDKHVATTYHELGRHAMRDGSQLIIALDLNNDDYGNRTIAWQHWRDRKQGDSGYLGYVERTYPYTTIRLTVFIDASSLVVFYDATQSTVYGIFDVRTGVPQELPRGSDAARTTMKSLKVGHGLDLKWLDQ